MRKERVRVTGVRVLLAPLDSRQTTKTPLLMISPDPIAIHKSGTSAKKTNPNNETLLPKVS